MSRRGRSTLRIPRFRARAPRRSPGAAARGWCSNNRVTISRRLSVRRGRLVTLSGSPPLACAQAYPEWRGWCGPASPNVRYFSSWHGRCCRPLGADGSHPPARHCIGLPAASRAGASRSGIRLPGSVGLESYRFSMNRSVFPDQGRNVLEVRGEARPRRPSVSRSTHP